MRQAFERICLIFIDIVKLFYFHQLNDKSCVILELLIYEYPEDCDVAELRMYFHDNFGVHPMDTRNVKGSFVLKFANTGNHILSFIMHYYFNQLLF